MRINGTIWFELTADVRLSERDVSLLEKIREIGSLTQAAKALGISYKTAWDALDKMNTYSKKVLVETCAGGKGGGNTVLTPYGIKVIAAYRRLSEQYKTDLAQTTKTIADL
jgi:molybdate transport system regulatory protein